MRDAASEVTNRARMWTPAAPAWSVLVLAAALLLGSAAGCTSSRQSYSVDHGRISTLPLPQERQVPYHPDSLHHLSFSEEEGKVKLTHDESYSDLVMAWSAGDGQRLRAAPRTHETITGTRMGPNTRRVGSASSFQNYALLWTRELSLLSLIPEAGIQSLERDVAYEFIAKREAEYDSLLQIDVFVFAPIERPAPNTAVLRANRLGDTRLDGGGEQVYLKDEDGRVYDPVRIEVFPFVEVNRSGRRAYYRRNAIFFRRSSDAGDLLDHTSLALYIGSGRRFASWVFPFNAALSMAE